MPNKKSGKVYKKLYTENDVTEALSRIANGMSVKKASIMYNIPRATLQFRKSSSFIKKSLGPPPILTKEEENTLKLWIIDSYKKGFPRRKEAIKGAVRDFLIENPRTNPFKNNCPGDGWYKAFMRRNPELTFRTSEAVTNASAVVSESDIKSWFSRIESYMKEHHLFNILQNPQRVFNGDETNFQLCPKNTKVIAPKGARNVYEVDTAQAKSALTCMFTFSALGDTTPPMIIYPLKRISSDIIRSVPEGWGIGRSDNGWMKAEVFYEYITNVFYPYLQITGVEFPIILFLDGHCTHLSYNVSKLCKELQIILICLYPNSTRILQPADVAVFKPLKDGWKRGVLKWKSENPTDQLTKEKFGYVLRDVVEAIKPETIKNGFRCCGLYPWNPLAIDYSKCLGKKKETLPKQTINKSKNLDYDTFCNIVGNETIQKFENIKDIIGTSSEDFLKLFQIWQEFMSVDDNRQDIDVENIPVIVSTATPINTSIVSNNLNETTNILPEDQTDVAVTRNDILIDVQPSTSFVNVKPETSLPLKEILSWPQVPERKGTRASIKTSFVLTSEDWQQMQEEKMQKKLNEEQIKREKQLKRKEQQILKEQNKKIKKEKNEKKKKGQTKLGKRKKVNVISCEILNDTSKLNPEGGTPRDENIE